MMMGRRIENGGACKSHCRLAWHGHLARESWAECLPVVLTGLLMLAAGCGREQSYDVPLPQADMPVELSPPAQAGSPSEPPEATFDHAEHEAALRRLAPVHHKHMAAVREAVQRRTEYEKQMDRATPERRAVADEIHALKAAQANHRSRLESIYMADAEWQRLRAEAREMSDRLNTLREPLRMRMQADPDALSRDEHVERELEALRALGQALRERREAITARETDLKAMRTDAADAAEAIERKGEQIAEAEARWCATFADDPAWQRLDAQVQTAEQAQDEVRQELATRIRARMQHDFARKRAERDGTEAVRN